jgi:hypothetical protein
MKGTGEVKLRLADSHITASEALDERDRRIADLERRLDDLRGSRQVPMLLIGGPNHGEMHPCPDRPGGTFVVLQPPVPLARIDNYTDAWSTQVSPQVAEYRMEEWGTPTWPGQRSPKGIIVGVFQRVR